MKNNHSICMVGHFGGDKVFNDGQTVKTKEIKDFLCEHDYKVSIVDTYSLKKHPFNFFLQIKNGVAKNDIVVLILSSRGYKIVSRLLVIMNERFHKKLFDFVIGGTRYQIIDEQPKFKKIAASFNKIFVETERMKDEYKKRGINNVEVIPNFKKIKKFPAKSNYIKTGELHACTFSRVIKEKGISDAINAVKSANRIDDEKKYYLDVYGKIDENYKDEFNSLLDDKVVYKGEADSKDASQIISEHDVLLFPTYWHGEGFPGTIIDAFFAASPVVATDWNDNFGILKDGKSGIKVRIKSPNEITEAIQTIAHNKKLFKAMSKTNHDEADKYCPEEAMKPFLHEIGEKRG